MQLAISRSLAELTKGSGVTVNAVLPGPTLTEGVETFIDALYPGVPVEEAGKRFIAENRSTSLIGRLILPAEVGDVVAFVCSARASIINGASIRAEGVVVRSIF
jgi:3-oxoacyl-[acyl-carrier protein] reductase